MKRIFTILFLAGSLTSMSQTSFLPTSVVVYRVGDGLATLRGVATKVYLDEYSPSGILIQSIPLPTATSGSNAALTASGSATSEGLMTRTADTKYLVFTGYDSDSGIDVKTATAATIQRVMGRINGAGNLDISTRFGTAAFSANNVRGVTSADGSSYYAGGATSGIRYGLFGDTSMRITGAASSNFRALAIFNGRLYATSNSGAAKGISAIGTGLPTDSNNAALNLLPGIPTSGSPYQFFFADLSSTVAGLDVLYIADDGATGGIQKYSFDGTTWNANGSALPTVTGTRGLTASVAGGVVTLYTTSGGSKLYSLVDGSGYNGTIATTFTELATAIANTAFRGVALAPQATITPLKLLSFKAHLMADAVELKWQTANEINVKNFTVEKSKSAESFVAINSVGASNTNGADYRFTDKSLNDGVNYYRLKMNDKNGAFSYSDVASVVYHHSPKVEVFPNPAINNITISHTKAVNGATIVISNEEGQQLTSMAVQAGTVQTIIAIDKLANGNYVVSFSNNGEKAVSRFVKK